jgi:hypothetical protein
VGERSLQQVSGFIAAFSSPAKEFCADFVFNTTVTVATDV